MDTPQLLQPCQSGVVLPLLLPLVGEVVPPMLALINFANITFILPIVKALTASCGWLWLVLGFSFF